MITHLRSTLIGWAIGSAIILLTVAILSRTSWGAPEPPIDRAALVVSDAPPVSAPPSVAPATVDEGQDLAQWVWDQFRAGRAALALIVGLQALGLVAIKRWAWVSQVFPRLKRGKALAATSSLVGSLAGLAPLAIAGASPWSGLVIAIGAAIGVYLLPGPAEVAGETVPSGAAS